MMSKYRLAKNAVRIALAALCIAMAINGHSQPSSQADLWQAIKSEGYVVLMRHSTAPGTGDPSNFALDDCATQRNLSRSGRDQAVRIGDRLRANGIESASVYASPWCRCMDTASLINLGEVTELMSLSSFYQNFQNQSPAQQNQALLQWLSQQPLDQPTVLVTHQVNITALTAVYPSEGQLVVTQVLESGELLVIGSIRPE